MRNSVDLPEPFGPIMPMRSPSSIERHTPEKSSRKPWDFERSRAVSNTKQLRLSRRDRVQKFLQ